VLGFIVVLVVIAGVGLVMWDRWWRHAGPANPGMSCPAVVKANDRVPFAAFGVHRVALIGDSIMDEASCSIADSLSGVGIKTSRYAVGGTGLLTGLVDWVAATRKIMQTEKPDVVVAIFVGNYFPPPLRDENGAVIAAGTPAFFRAWQERAELLSQAVHSGGAQMYWVRPPPISDPQLAHAQQLFDGYRKIRGDHSVSSGRVLAGSDDRFVMTKQTCGRRRAIRMSDRVHLTDDGARIFGQQIAHDLTMDWGILTTPRPC
jgi:hypothetical protein